MTESNSKFAKSYTEKDFWDKLLNFAKAAGREVIELALQLYYALQATNTPAWAKAVIIGALGYFISPIDAVPDIIPMAGYVDDLGVLTAAVATVAAYITDDVKAKAEAQVKKWFD